MLFACRKDTENVSLVGWFIPISGQHGHVLSNTSVKLYSILTCMYCIAGRNRYTYVNKGTALYQILIVCHMIP